jgi:hypothetical protein
VIGSRWGSLAGGPVRSGGRQYRLVVFPPGTDGRERWLLRLWHTWPAAGALLATVLLGELGDAVDLTAGLTASAAFFLAPLLWLRHALRRPRRDLVVVHADYLHGPGSPADLARCRRVVSLYSMLTDAEQALDRGELAPVEFQRVWGDVHAEARALEAVRRAA